jgi:hypothetical protein
MEAAAVRQDESGDGDEEEVEDEEDEEEEDKEEDFHEIEGIFGRRNDHDYGLMYLVRYLDKTRRWLTPEHITREAIDEYEGRRGRA